MLKENVFIRKYHKIIYFCSAGIIGLFLLGSIKSNEIAGVEMKYIMLFLLGFGVWIIYEFYLDTKPSKQRVQQEFVYQEQRRNIAPESKINVSMYHPQQSVPVTEDKPYRHTLPKSSYHVTDQIPVKPKQRENISDRANDVLPAEMAKELGIEQPENESPDNPFNNFGFKEPR